MLRRHLFVSKIDDLKGEWNQTFTVVTMIARRKVIFMPTRTKSIFQIILNAFMLNILLNLLS